MTDPSEVERLPESRLGTKEHWDSVYTYVYHSHRREVKTYKEIGDEGEVWYVLMAHAGLAKTVSSG